MKEKHSPTLQPPDDFKEVSDFVTCKMCNIQQRRALLARHLVQKHGINCEQDGKKLRSFKSDDNGLSWLPFAMYLHESDPPASVIVDDPHDLDPISTIVEELEHFESVATVDLQSDDYQTEDSEEPQRLNDDLQLEITNDSKTFNVEGCHEEVRMGKTNK